ncbi:MAG: DMT family transporter, partial [Maritimibacter sp.]|nr:DMT family transporter [Maritimibacter sp.]
MTRTTATLIGFSAVALWALLALFTVATAPVPPFQLNAMSFAIGGAVGLVWLGLTGGFGQLARVSWRVYLFGTLGLFGYHAFYFTALRLAPPAEAGLIAYLWPLLIVLFSGLLPGEKLRAGHVIGAVVSLAGAALILVGSLGGGLGGGGEGTLAGYGFAIACALTWSGYSVLSRRLGATPTASVAVFCLATAALSGVAHLAFEDTVAPAGA